jgi:hypothetical protein
VGLLLLGLRSPLLYLVSGYPFVRNTKNLLYLPINFVSSRSVRRQIAGFRDLHWKAKRLDNETPQQFASRRRAEWQLGVRFPNAEQKVLPTRLGNSIRAWEDHARTRWALETVAVWPRISAFQSDQEAKLQADAETDFAFFLNSSIGAVVAGATMALNGMLEKPHPAALAWIYVVPFVLAYFLYRASVGAAQRWGHHVKASIDLHRFDLYDKLGVRRPTTGTEIRQAGAAINRMLLYGEAMPDEMLIAERTGGNPEED